MHFAGDSRGHIAIESFSAQYSPVNLAAPWDKDLTPPCQRRLRPQQLESKSNVDVASNATGTPAATDPCHPTVGAQLPRLLNRHRPGHCRIFGNESGELRTGATIYPGRRHLDFTDESGATLVLLLHRRMEEPDEGAADVSGGPGGECVPGTDSYRGGRRMGPRLPGAYCRGTILH